MTDISVRLLTKDETPLFRELRLRGLQGEPNAFFDAYEDAVTWSEEKFASYFDNGWIAGGFVDGKLLGMAGLYRSKGKKIEHRSTIWGVYVAPEARGHKLGYRILELLMKEAKAAGIELVLLSTNTMTPITQNLYKSLGFEPYGIEKHILKLADGSYIDDMLMIKFLK